MREMKCPVCGGEVPRTALRSKIFPCPTCKESLRSKEWSPLWVLPLAACGYLLTFLTAEWMGLKGNALFMVTVLLGPFAAIPAASVLGLSLAWVFGIPPRLKRDPGPRAYDGGILHIDSAPGPRKGPS